MPKFAYAAIDPNGAAVEGITKAETIGDARKVLMGQNLFPTKLSEHRGAMSFELTKEKVKKKELMHFTRQLAVFVKAGIPITEALETIGDETEDIAPTTLARVSTSRSRYPARLSSVVSKRPVSSADSRMPM